MITPRQASEAAAKSINANFVKKNRPPSAGKGRKPGQRNVVSRTIREMFSEFIAFNAPKVQTLFDKVASKDPAKALQIYTGMADFVLPRLARTEVVNSGDPLVSLNVTNVTEAAATYQSLLSNTKFDLSANPVSSWPRPIQWWQNNESPGVNNTRHLVSTG